MSDLRDWLGRHKLEQYADAFEANDIDLDILPELNDGDLEKLGVSLGNRRRLLKAIAEGGSAAAKQDFGAKQDLAAKQDLPEPKAPEPAADAERRQVTVMFCDMVGSTALSGTVDCELLGNVIRRYQDTTAGVIGRFGGFVAKFMGDGVLAYFGFPHAFEDAAERAVRAAIGILTEVGSIALPDGTRIQARVGIATGLVVVGEIVGTGTAQERTIVGETPNLAARLQALATPDTILISESTQSLLGGLFDLDPTGEHTLKGFSRPIPVWRVRGEASIESRFAAARSGGKLPLIGRANEMGLLLDRWRLAQAGEGQIVTVIGEAGIGKSRAVEALQEAVAAEPHRRIHLQCSAYHTDSALYPVIQQLSRAAGFAAPDSPAARLEKLETLFAQRGASDPAAVPLIAELLSIPVASTTAPSTATPAQRKAAILALLVDDILRGGEGAPILLVVEDAHWIDATTLELLTRLADSIGQARFLAVVTARPDFTAPWQTRPHATLLTLGRLGRAECAELVASVAESHGLSADTMAAIVAKTDGVPLFVEELTKSVMESAGEDSAAVPATLKDSLTARLDRLGEAREVAQIASVIGRQFAAALLDVLMLGRRTDLDAALAKLVAAGIVLPEGRALEQSFSFKHALTRDAAYESLLLSRRREWHERIARVLEKQFADLAAAEPDLLAHHFGEAGLPGPACDYRMRAGDQAVSRSAYKEAIAHFSAGLKAAETMAQADERSRRQLDFLLKLGPALMVMRGIQSDEVAEVYRHAEEIGAALGDGRATYQAKWGLWLSANLKRKTASARDRANELVTLAQSSDDGDLLLEAYHCRWSTAFFCGDVAAALVDSGRGIEMYDIERHRHLGLAFGGHDPGVCAHSQCGNALHLSGERDRAAGILVRAVTLAEELDHPNSLAHALHNRGIAHQLVTDREAVSVMAQRGAALTDKFGLMQWRAGNLILAAWADAIGDGTAKASHVMETEIENAAAVGPLPQYYRGLAAEVLLGAGRAADGLAQVDRAIAGIDEPGVGFFLPEIYRLRGQCLLALSRTSKDEARQTFTTARDIARRQGAVLFERRADAALAETA
ncbi:MAG TPA: adenylate/guanylate cyclase domain-containing protein [Xanthobacteraceae bacterium]